MKEQKIKVRPTKVIGKTFDETLVRDVLLWSKHPPLSTTHPEIAKQWHPTKNGTWTPDDFTYGSGESVWWQCPVASDHVWQGKVFIRTNGNAVTFGCPFCTGRRVSRSNSLASLFPTIAKEWHPTKNGKLTPSKVVSGSETLVWWKCQHDPEHEWQQTVTVRTSQSANCPFCAGKRVSSTNSLAALRPDVARQWHPTKNGKLKPSAFTPFSSKVVWWICEVAPDHQWQGKIASRTNAVGCPFCSSRRPSVSNSLAAHYPEVAKQWHKEKNGALTANDVTANSNKKVWWQCSKNPEHAWQAKVQSRTTRKSGCHLCSGRAVCQETSLRSRYPSIAAQWHKTKNGSLTPDQVVPASSKLIWWQCKKAPDHEWRAALGNRTRGAGCPFCAGKQASSTYNLAQSYPHVASQWHPCLNQPHTPRDVVPGSGKKYWWQCPLDPEHTWQSSIDKRTRGKTGCPHCPKRWRRSKKSQSN